MIDCEVCYYWERERKNSDWGVCRKNAPVPTLTSSNAYVGPANFRTVWPYTRASDGCGDGAVRRKGGPKKPDQADLPSNMSLDNAFNTAVKTAKEKISG